MLLLIIILYIGADPSGADAQSVIDEMLAKSTGDKTTWTNNGDGTFSGSNNATATDEDHVTNPHESEMKAIAGDLNRIYKDAYGKTPFSVEKQSRTRRVKVKDGGWFGDDEYEEQKYDVYVLTGSIGFNWNKDKYTKMLKSVMDADVDITADIIADKGPQQRSVTHGNKYHGLLTLRGGGLY